MPKFRCVVKGENFPGSLIGEHGRRVGFYTTRWVEAPDANEAEMRVLAMLRDDETFARTAASERSPDATVFFESIDEMEEDAPVGVNRGFSFFTDD